MANVSDEMKEVLKNFLKTGKKLQDLKNDTKEQRLIYADLSDKIKMFLSDQGVDNLNTNNGSIQKKKRVKRSGINRALLLECLKECEHLDCDEEMVEKIVKFIYDSRSSEEVEELKIIDV